MANAARHDARNSTKSFLKKTIDEQAKQLFFKKTKQHFFQS
jgi:hypothetical protein